MNRQVKKANSNNPDNPNQNICAMRVCQALGVADQVRYLHTISDVKRAAGKRFSVRSVKSAAKSNTVGGARSNLKAVGALAYIVHVEGHVLLLNADGESVVDTDARKRDRRKMLGVWGVYAK